MSASQKGTERKKTIHEQATEVMTQPEVAELLRVTPRTVRNMTSSGVLPHFVLGRLVRYRREEVLAAMERFSV